MGTVYGKHLAHSVHNGQLALLWSCGPGQDAAWLFGFHPQRHEARRFVLGFGPLDGRGPEASREAVERVEAVDARVVGWVVVVGMAGGWGHAHEPLQVAVGVRVRAHAGRGDGVGTEDATGP